MNMNQCPICRNAGLLIGSTGPCANCGASRIVAEAILKQQQPKSPQQLMRSLLAPSRRIEHVIQERKGPRSYAEINRGASAGEPTYVQGNVFVGTHFLPNGEPPPSVLVVKEVCAGRGLAARHFFVQHEYPGVAVEALQAIENAEFLIFDLSTPSANVYGELCYALGCGNQFAWMVLLARPETRLAFMVDRLQRLSELDLVRYDDANSLRTGLSRVLIEKGWGGTEPPNS